MPPPPRKKPTSEVNENGSPAPAPRRSTRDRKSVQTLAPTVADYDSDEDRAVHRSASKRKAASQAAERDDDDDDMRDEEEEEDVVDENDEDADEEEMKNAKKKTPKKAASKAKTPSKAATPSKSTLPSSKRIKAEVDADGFVKPAPKKKTPPKKAASRRKAAADEDEKSDTATEAEAGNEKEPTTEHKFDKELSKLYNAVADPRSALREAVHSWVESYQGSTDRALNELANFTLHACGARISFSVKETSKEDRYVLVEKAVKKSTQAADAYPLRKVKKFKQRFIEFWDKLIKEIQSNELFDEVLVSYALDWLINLSLTRLRSFRHTGTVGAFALTSSLITVATDLMKKCDICKTQLETEQKKSKPVAKKVAQLEENLNEWKERLEAVDRLMMDVFTAVFIHRYRDVDPFLRVLCFEHLGNWMQSYPRVFMRDDKLRYIGWCLNDKDASVRRAALQALLPLYDPEHKEIVHGLTGFTERFKKRLSDMCNDVDTSVAAVAIDCMTAMLRCGFFEENDGENLPSFIWDADPHVRDAAVRFVYEDTFAEDADKESETKNADDLVQLLNIFDKYCPIVEERKLQAEQEEQDQQQASSARSKKQQAEAAKIAAARKQETANSTYLQQPMEYLVQGFWELLPVLKDWVTIGSALLQSESEHKRGRGTASTAPDDDRQTTLSFFLLAAVKKATGKMETGKKFTTKQQESLDESSVEVSQYLISNLPELLTTFQSNANKLVALVRLVTYIDLEHVVKLRKKKEFRQLLDVIRTIYLMHSNQFVLEETATSLHHLAGTEHQHKDDAETMVREMSTGLIQDLKRQVEEQDMSAPASSPLIITLRRLTYIYRQLSIPEISWNLNPVFQTLFQNYAKNEDGNEVVRHTLTLAYHDLLWMVSALNKEEPDATALKQIVDHHHHLSVNLEYVFNNSPSIEVKDTAFAITSDLFVMFSQKLHGTSLTELAATPSIAFKAAYNDYFSTLVSASDIEARLASQSPTTAVDEETLIQRNRTHAIVSAAKVVAYDHSQHQILAGRLLANFHKYDKVVDDMIKWTQRQLNSINTEALLDAQLSALQQSYEARMPNAELRELAQHLTLSHAMKAETRSFLPLFRKGLIYALRDAPSHLTFLEFALQPYVLRASSKDLVAIVGYYDRAVNVCKRRVKDEDPNFDDADFETSDWKPLEVFRAELEKRIKKRGVQAIAAATPAKKMGGALFSPSSQISSIAPVDTPRSVMSKQPNFEDDEEMEEKKTAPSAAKGRKRGREDTEESKESDLSLAAIPESKSKKGAKSKSTPKSSTKKTRSSQPAEEDQEMNGNVEEEETETQEEQEESQPQTKKAKRASRSRA